MTSTAHAIEVSFDDDADRAVRAVWEALDEVGIPSLRQGGDGYRPHLSLSVFAGGRLDAIAELVAGALVDDRLPEMLLSHLGFFLAPRRVLFCGITPSAELLATQRSVDEAIRRGGGVPWPHYCPRSWVPHCTLAMDVSGQISRLEILADLGLPMVANARAVRLVEVPSGVAVAEFSPAVQT